MYTYLKAESAFPSPLILWEWPICEVESWFLLNGNLWSQYRVHTPLHRPIIKDFELTVCIYYSQSNQTTTWWLLELAVTMTEDKSPLYFRELVSWFPRSRGSPFYHSGVDSEPMMCSNFTRWTECGCYKCLSFSRPSTTSVGLPKCKVAEINLKQDFWTNLQITARLGVSIDSIIKLNSSVRLKL